MAAESEAFAPPDTPGKTVTNEPAAMSDGLIGVPSILTSRTNWSWSFASLVGFQSVTHRSESLPLAHGFLIRPPRMGTTVARPSAPPASASDAFRMPRRLTMPILSPVSNTSAAIVCRSISSDMPMCRCCTATSCGAIFLASAITPMPKNRMQPPNVMPSSGV